MGTRGFIGLIIAGKRHAVYNHFDSYPDGLGRDVVRFINSLTKEQIDEMIKRLEEVTVSLYPTSFLLQSPGAWNEN